MIEGHKGDGCCGAATRVMGVVVQGSVHWMMGRAVVQGSVHWIIGAGVWFL